MGPGEFLSIDFFTALFTLGNTIVLFLVLKKLLFKPVMKMIQDRQKEIDDMYADADQAKLEADNLRSEYEQKLSVAAQTGERMIKEATERGQQRQAQILQQAQGVNEITGELPLDLHGGRRDDVFPQLMTLAAGLCPLLLRGDIFNGDVFFHFREFQPGADLIHHLDGGAQHQDPLRILFPDLFPHLGTVAVVGEQSRLHSPDDGILPLRGNAGQHHIAGNEQTVIDDGIHAQFLAERHGMVALSRTAFSVESVDFHGF